MVQMFACDIMLIDKAVALELKNAERRVEVGYGGRKHTGFFVVHVPKIRAVAHIVGRRDGIITSCRMVSLAGVALSPDAELRAKLAICGMIYRVHIKRTIESHEPVQRLSASLLTPRQLTRLSCPCNVPTRSPRRTSQT